MWYISPIKDKITNNGSGHKQERQGMINSRLSYVIKFIQTV